MTEENVVYSAVNERVTKVGAVVTERNGRGAVVETRSGEVKAGAAGSAAGVATVGVVTAAVVGGTRAVGAAHCGRGIALRGRRIEKNEEFFAKSAKTAFSPVKEGMHTTYVLGRQLRLPRQRPRRFPRRPSPPMAVAHPQCAERVRRYFAEPAGQERYFRLLECTERMIRTKHWCVATTDRQAPGGQGAVDLFGQVYVALMEGRRSFPDEVSVELGIRCIVRSAVNHLALGFENTHRSDHLVEDEAGEIRDELDTAQPFWDPTTEDFTEEEAGSAAARCARFLDFCADDPDLVALLRLIRDEGIDGPAKLIAERIGVPEVEVYNIRKRLATAVRKFERNSP